MKALILTLVAMTLAGAAHADQIVTEKTTSGVYSAPVAGATPQARQHPAEDTTMGEAHRKTTVEEVPSRTVIRQGGSVSVDVGRSPRD